MQNEFEPVQANLGDVIREFRTEIKATPSFESHDVLINAVKDSERYFPPELTNLITLRDPTLSLANFTDADIRFVEAHLAKMELIVLSKIPRWREDEIRNVILSFGQLKIYVRSHLSRARKGHFLDKVTQISKVISYQTNMPPMRRRRFPFFGGGEY